MPPVKMRARARKATPIIVFALGTWLPFGQNATRAQTTPPEGLAFLHISGTLKLPSEIEGHGND
jgi:hypothetical protein